MVEVGINVATIQQSSVQDVLGGEDDFKIKFPLQSACNVHDTWVACLVLIHKEIVSSGFF